MEKIKILVLPSDKSGVGAFRSINPHLKLEALYPDQFHVDIDFNPDINNLEKWKKYQIVSFHRSIGGDLDKSVEIIKKLNEMGIITVCDIDDYWSPTMEHPLYHEILRNKQDEKIKDNLRASSFVTTTTEIFAEIIRKFHKNVFVIPNAIDGESEQFSKNEIIEDKKLRFGWLGGSSHLHDIKLMEGTVELLTPLKEKMKIVLCGFDTRGNKRIIDKRTGMVTVTPIKPEETVWVEYEKIFTSNYKLVSPDFKKVLMEYKEMNLNEYSDESYLRRWTLPVTSYAKNYSYFDVLLAPIKNHIFNRVKSQLKVIEAGFKRKAIMASNVGPYTIDLKHAFTDGKLNDSGNAILIEESRNHRDWYKYMKKLIENPEIAGELGNRLFETVKDKYNLKEVVKERSFFYKKIIKNEKFIK